MKYEVINLILCFEFWKLDNSALLNMSDISVTFLLQIRSFISWFKD